VTGGNGARGRSAKDSTPPDLACSKAALARLPSRLVGGGPLRWSARREQPTPAPLRRRIERQVVGLTLHEAENQCAAKQVNGNTIRQQRARVFNRSLVVRELAIDNAEDLPLLTQKIKVVPVHYGSPQRTSIQCENGVHVPLVVRVSPHRRNGLAVTRPRTPSPARRIEGTEAGRGTRSRRGRPSCCRNGARFRTRRNSSHAIFVFV